MSNVVTDLWIRDRFKEPVAGGLKALRALQPEFFGELDCRFPHLFLFSLDSLDVLATQDKWIVRDGFLLLKFFFEKFPKRPENSTFKLYIQQELAILVPEGWSGVVYTYAVTSLDHIQNKKLKVLFNPNVPSLKNVSSEIKQNNLEVVGLTLSNKSFGFNFIQSEKKLVSFFSELNSRSAQIEFFPLDYYAQYPNAKEGTSFVDLSDNFLCALSQSFMMYLNCNFRLLNQKVIATEVEEIKMNLYSSFFISKTPVVVCSPDPKFEQLHQLVERSSEDAPLPHFPFSQNYAKASFEIWRSK